MRPEGFPLSGEELVSCAGEAAQLEPCEDDDILGLDKEGLDFLAVDAGGLMGPGPHRRLGVVAGQRIRRGQGRRAPVHLLFPARPRADSRRPVTKQYKS